MKKAVIVLPTYNEGATIEQVIEGIMEVTAKLEHWEVHALVVESTSTDNTDEVVTRLQKKYKRLHILRTKKEGLGKAYIRGFKYAIEEMNAYLLFEMDSDLSHDVNKLPEFFEKIENGADFVIGSRYIKGGSIPADWGFHRKLFSVLGNTIIRFGFMNLKITDWTSGYRAIKAWVVADVIDKIETFTGYVFQVALLDNAIKKGVHVAEIPFNFKDRIDGHSKIDSVEYIMQTLMYVFFESSFIKFVIVGGTGFIIDSAILWFLALKLHYPAWHAKLISAEVAIISNFTLNNSWSFSHKKLHFSLSNYLRALGKFNLVSLGNILIQTIGITIMTEFFGKHNILIYNAMIILLIVVPYSYFVYNKFIWKDTKKS